MSEVHEAEALARWLDDPQGTPVPDSIDAEVTEAIYALKPALAPAPQLSIEDILDCLLEGPLVDPTVADALRNWLTAGPGTPPPRILPIGVVEATYTLRPEMAPSPTLTIDDILDGVSSGPLASTPPPLRLHTAAENSVSPPLQAPARRWNQTLAGLAVAAIALIVMIPDSATVLSQPTPFDDGSAVANTPELHDVSFAEAEMGSPPPPPKTAPKAEAQTE